MLHAEDAGIHYEAVGVIGNLVHSSQARPPPPPPFPVQEVPAYKISSSCLLCPRPAWVLVLMIFFLACMDR